MTTDAGDVPIIALTYVPVKLTDAVPPLTMAEIGETPTTDVSPEVDAGIKMVRQNRLLKADSRLARYQTRRR